MADSKQAVDVATYGAAVRAALALQTSLAESERESLLEDLEDHLAEVAGESDVPLQERLGKPDAYAAELRSAYAGGAAACTTSGRAASPRWPPLSVPTSRSST